MAYPKKVTETMIREMGILYSENGMSLRKIADRFDLAIETVNRYLEESGVTKRSRGPVSVPKPKTVTLGKTRLTEEEKSSIAHLHKEGKSFADIARLFGVSSAAISFQAKKLGVAPRIGRKDSIIIPFECHGDIINKYASGLSMRALAREYDCHNCTIQKILKVNNTYIRRSRTKIELPDGFLRCTRCETNKPEENFHPHMKHKSKNNKGCCIDCFRDMKLLRVYGIPLVEYNDILSHQRGTCAICHGEPTEISGEITRAYHVDHDHTTKEVRGLLCKPCNTGLGDFKDSVTLLENAIEYLKNPPYKQMKELNRTE